MSSIEPTPTQDFYVHIGAPEPIKFRRKEGGVYVSFDSSLKFQYVNAAGTVVLGVGEGITLSAVGDVPDAEATVRLTVEQSRSIPKRARTRYEVQRVVGGDPQVFMMGKLIGEGGDNPDD